MATIGITLSAEITDLKELQAELQRVFTPAQKAKVCSAALQKAKVPLVNALREVTPVGPTGNLRRAISSKTKGYDNSGAATTVIGFRRAAKEDSQSAAGGTVRKGPDRARHQYWLEEGTAERIISKPAGKPYRRRAHKRTMKSGVVALIQEHPVARQGGYIASSFGRLGPFEVTPTPRMPRGSGSPQRVQTQPGYPNAFFKKSSQPIRIPPMLPGGRAGLPPIQTALARGRGEAAQILSRELRVSIERMWEGIGRIASGTLP